ncbi:MAG: hypothetical protein CG442_1163, partial [Methylococcaceae bacterium NSO1]
AVQVTDWRRWKNFRLENLLLEEAAIAEKAPAAQ